MKSKRLNKHCKHLQEHDSVNCVCQTGLFRTVIVDPCVLPCDHVLESFLNGLVG